jgi:hypothetical protein
MVKAMEKIIMALAAVAQKMLTCLINTIQTW